MSVAMTSEMPMCEYPNVQGLVIEVVDDEAIPCRYIRGLQNPVRGGPDLPVAGDPSFPCMSIPTRCWRT